MDTEKKCTVIITATFKEGGREMPEFKEYSEKSNANGEAHGGVVVAKYMVEDNLGDGVAPQVVFVIEYPSREQAVATFTNEHYQTLIPLRNAALESVNILITK